MSTKTCPSCGIEVPTVAKRCKSCFHDFTEVRSNKGLTGLLVLLAAMAASSVAGAITLYLITAVPLEENVLVDQDTQSVVWTRHYRSGIQTERLAWRDVTKLEYIVHRNGGYELTAVTGDGTRKTVIARSSPLKSEATQYSELMKKPLEEINKSSGFGGDLK